MRRCEKAAGKRMERSREGRGDELFCRRESHVILTTPSPCLLFHVAVVSQMSHTWLRTGRSGQTPWVNYGTVGDERWRPAVVL